MARAEKCLNFNIGKHSLKITKRDNDNKNIVLQRFIADLMPIKFQMSMF